MAAEGDLSVGSRDSMEAPLKSERRVDTNNFQTYDKGEGSTRDRREIFDYNSGADIPLRG